MNILFIHDAFPAQFGFLALNLKKRYNYNCSFLFQSISRMPDPTEEMFKEFNLYQLPIINETGTNIYSEKCKNVRDAVKNLKPDLIVSHGVNGAPTTLINDIPVIIYCEYFLPRSPGNPDYYHINDNILLSLDHCKMAFAPLNWTKSLFPEKYQSKIKVCFEGIDTEFWCPGLGPKPQKDGRKIITFVARGLESTRGFDLFMKVAKRLPDNIYFIVVGEEKVYYGPPEEIKKDYDSSRFIFAGMVPREQLRNILQLSDLHLYLSKPYAVSWSLFNAMACGTPVLALDTPPICEIIEDNYFLTYEDRLVDKILKILDNPRSLRHVVEEKYSLDTCVPLFKDLCEQCL